MDFDTEQFIIEIQNRPAIWNTKCPEYSQKHLKQKEWDELVDIYGADISTDERKSLAVCLQKKWRNIRDNFVKAYKAKYHNKNTKNGSTAKKKTQYIFYNHLLFLKDTVAPNSTPSNVTSEIQVKEEVSDTDSSTSYSSTTQNNKKKKNDDHIVQAWPGGLHGNIENNYPEEDEDRLFFLSLVKDFKKIPEDLQTQTKIDILKVIKDAQSSD